MDLLKTLPKWLLVSILAYIAVLFSYAVYDNRTIEFFPPKIFAKEPHIPAVSSASSSSQSTIHSTTSLQHFNLGDWGYFAIAKQGGAAVQDRLNQIQPPPDGLVIAYDGSANDTFHVWYRGGGTGARYKYRSGTPNELKDPPDYNFFFADQARVPAGIGTAGGVAVPIYFDVTLTH